jgi:20S proteasome alpha/beta subunit
MHTRAPAYTHTYTRNHMYTCAGSVYIYGFCDKYWRPDMSEADAKDFVVHALSHAMARDASSGGCVRTVR